MGRKDYGHEFIRNIVKVVSDNINRAHLYVADYLVGLESPMQEVCSLLGVGPRYDDKVRMVGIHGTTGVGKTTLAKAIFNLIADNFDCACFLENVKDNSRIHGLEHLQETLLFEVVGLKDIKLGGISKGIQRIKQRLRQENVLLILDGVDEQKQLEALVGGPNWFGSTSRVIITTESKDLLLCHKVEKTYNVESLNEENALKLFKWNAFRGKEVDQSYDDIIKHAVTRAAGLPLALKEIGSKLGAIKIEEWKFALNGGSLGFLEHYMIIM